MNRSLKDVGRVVSVANGLSTESELQQKRLTKRQSTSPQVLTITVGPTITHPLLSTRFPQVHSSSSSIGASYHLCGPVHQWHLQHFISRHQVILCYKTHYLYIWSTGTSALTIYQHFIERLVCACVPLYATSAAFQYLYFPASQFHHSIRHEDLSLSSCSSSRFVTFTPLSPSRCPFSVSSACPCCQCQCAPVPVLVSSCSPAVDALTLLVYQCLFTPFPHFSNDRQQLLIQLSMPSQRL